MAKLKSILASFMLLVFLVTRTSIAYAQEAEDDGDYVEITEGEAAPYSGFLFDKSGMANLIATRDLQIAREKLKLETDINLLKIDTEAQIKKKQIELDINKVMYEDLLKIKQTRISALETDANLGNVKLIGGFALGVVISIAIFYAAAQVGK